MTYLTGKYARLAVLFITLLGLGGCALHTSGTLESSMEVLGLHSANTPR